MHQIIIRGKRSSLFYLCDSFIALTIVETEGGKLGKIWDKSTTLSIQGKPKKVPEFENFWRKENDITGLRLEMLNIIARRNDESRSGF